MAKVVLENIHKTYPGEKGREVSAVEDACLTIEEREFMVFVGPSGCGKSTTLRMIAGLEEITRGNIYIDGKRINDVAPKDRDIAMVFQNYALYPHMTVYKNMAFGLELRRHPRAEIDARVQEAAQILGLTREMLERRPKALSGGQRQRVALGRAIVRKPKVFLFDEPLSNLDAKMRVQTRTEISKLHQRLATTMIYVTHDQVEAMTMGDRICLMKDGRIQQVAEPLEIYNAPANMYVAAFIGSPPMNFFAGTLAARDGKLFFSEKAGEGTEGFTLRVDERHAPKLAPRLDQPVYLGLRPEDIVERQVAAAAPPGQIFRATIDLVEAMGAETLLYLKTAAHGCIARFAGQIGGQPAAKIELVAHMERAHYFEAADPAAHRKDTGAPDLEKWQAACRTIV
ncbi:MAG TPA: sn-glycerol-3-phosphate ABC transporter ATP-binding protein UgpC [Candidatus Methylacidiphilales bacterium]|jgi:multiple sugar transport system ATP-binding protein|nr:sn-glycerol-3-phosphate ABC transporter ATP-binding protein UgpC [Candidatus Methylacidiphilales bacterium]